MRKGCWLLIVALFLELPGYAAKKDSGSAPLKNVQAAGTTDKKHKKQQYDLTFVGASEYTCRTSEKEKVNATDWVVGSSINYQVKGNKGEIKNTQSAKKVNCTIVRVAAVGTPAQ